MDDSKRQAWKRALHVTGSNRLTSFDLLHFYRIHPGAYQVVAHGTGGVSFTASLGKNFRQFADAMSRINEADIAMNKTVRKYGLMLSGMEAHLRNLALEKAGIIRYEAVLDKNMIAFYTEKTCH